METRFRKFISNRRARSATEADNDLIRKSASYEASPPTTRPPIFLYQPLAKSALEVRRDCEKDAVPMRSFSYSSVTSGKAPVFIQSLPQKGNGPVKLQANRRLSSGELVMTTDDSQETLQDIRDGDYVVGRKGRSMSISQGRSNTHVNELRMSPVQSPNHSPLPTPNSYTSISTHTWPESPRLEHDNHRSSRNSVDKAAPNIGLGLSSPTSAFAGRPRPSQDSIIDHRPSFSRQSASHESSNPHQNLTQNGNATLQALRRAEYSRLVEIYGAEAAARNLARLNREHYQAAASPVPPMQSLYSPVIFEPLVAPPVDSRHVDSRCTSRMSGTSSEWSGTSSPRRRSYVSSYAGSSTATAQTSIIEEDPATTREDIRNMVEQMRSTYLDAFEQRAPPTTKPKPRRKKQRKPKLIPSPVLNTSDQHSSCSLPFLGRQTWHPEDSDQHTAYTRRINSQPVNGTGRLSPIQASPRRNDDNEAGIKRADSTTLGGVMADVTRSRIRASQTSKRRTEQQHAPCVPAAATVRPVTPKQTLQEENKDSWLNLESDSADELFVESPHGTLQTCQHPRVVSHHSLGQGDSDHVEPRAPHTFERIYEDLFGKDGNDFWSSPSNIDRMPSLRVPSPDRVHDDANQLSTPQKAPQILSIPEFPEYRHLAPSGQTEPTFI